MRKIVTLFVCMVALISVARAQGICTPDTTHFTGSTHIYPASLPCINPGTAYSGTISIKVPDSIDAHLFVSTLPANTYYLYVDSMTIDSITGLPAGITSSTNPGVGGWLHGGRFGCATFAGTSNASPGNYTLGIFGRGCVHGTIFGFPIDTCTSGNFSSFLGFSLSVCGTSMACTPDTTHFTASTHIYPATLPCITPGVAYSGTISIKIPDSIDAHLMVSALPPNTYFLYVDSMSIDSMNGLPSGITYAANPAAGAWQHGGRYGCATFSGTTNAAPGNYPLGVFGHGCVHGSILGFPVDSCTGGDFSSFIGYSLTICGSAASACIVDTAALASKLITPDSLPCITPSQPYTGSISLRVPDSIDAHALYNLIPAGTANAIVDTIQIVSITGMPSGITVSGSPVLSTYLRPGQYGCELFSGTTSVSAGVYTITMTGNICGVVTLAGFPIHRCVNNISLATIYPFHLTVCGNNGIADIAEGLELSIYPNPSQGDFFVSLNSAERLTGDLSVIDALGRVVHTQSVDMTGTKVLAIPTAHMTPGIYAIMILANGKRSIREVVIE